MRVDPHDGRCRSCGGELEITDTDDATMTVECTQCGDEYQVEPDAFGDGAQDYYVEAHCEQLRSQEPEPKSPTLAELPGPAQDSANPCPWLPGKAPRS